MFGRALDGLILAEIEMAREDQFVALPPWVEQEVTADQRYRNSRLAAVGCRTGGRPDTHIPAVTPWHVLIRRFELYADAATHLEERVPRRDDQ